MSVFKFFCLYPRLNPLSQKKLKMDLIFEFFDPKHSYKKLNIKKSILSFFDLTQSLSYRKSISWHVFLSFWMSETNCFCFAIYRFLCRKSLANSAFKTVIHLFIHPASYNNTNYFPTSIPALLFIASKCASHISFCFSLLSSSNPIPARSVLTCIGIGSFTTSIALSDETNNFQN